MKGQELLKEYPLAADVVRKWFLNQMIESLKTESIDEDFKNFMREQGIEDDKLGTLIDVNPRMLFDVFDENNIIMQIIPIKEDEVKYLSRVNQFDTPYDFKRPYFTRKAAEENAVIECFKLLEEKLTPIDLPKINETSNDTEL